MGLLFRNALKGLKKKKVQMLGIVTLILLGTAIFTAMNSSLDRMEDNYYDYIKEANVQDFGITPTIDYTKDYTYEEIDYIINNKMDGADELHKMVMQKYALCLMSKAEGCIDDSLKQMISGIFYIYNLNLNKYEEKLESLSEKHNFIYEYQESKSITDGKYITVAFPYKDKEINKPYLIEGRVPENQNEITVLKLFAEENNLEINGKYKINNKEYKIVGYMYASDYIYPIISITNPMYDKKYNNIIFMTEEGFKNINGISQNDYVGRFVNRKNVNESFSNLFNINFKDPEFKENTEGDATLSMSGMLSLMRTRQPEMEFETNRLFAEYFLYFLLSICVIVILIITKKRIDDEKLQIGVLKSLGYKSFSIATSYLVYPIIGSLIGGILGYFAGYLLNPILTNLYKMFYCFPIGDNFINFNYLLKVIFIPMIALCILSYIVSLLMLRKKPLSLLREGSNLKVNHLTKLTTFLTKKLSFNKRFKYSLASRSLGKLFIIFLTSFTAGMLIILTLIGMNLFGSMIEKKFGEYHFNYQINYMVPQYGEDDKNNLIYNINMNLENVLNKKDKEKEYPDDKYEFAFIGIDKDFTGIDFKDNKDNDLKPLVKDNEVIITTPIQDILKVEIGDKLVMNYNNKNFTYIIAGVYQDYFDTNIVIDRKTLSLDSGLEKEAYNIKLTKEDDYDNIMEKLDEKELSQISNLLSLDQLRDNLDGAMSKFNTSMYVVVGFASFMALIVIGVVANIVVEENKRTISLMKVMGYKNKTISKIVLNIYTPFVIVAYFISIPATIVILKLIVNALVSNMNISIPITLSWQNALIGLLGLLISYYIAINLSRKVLNKVPLSVALKRE